MQKESGEEYGKMQSGESLKQGDERKDRKRARSSDVSANEETGDSEADAAAADDDEKDDDLSRWRREKRLAMNRESARLRRSRKKVLLKTLEERVEELTRENQSYKVTNDILNARVQSLERELAGARFTIASLMDRKSPPAVQNTGVRRLLGAQQVLAHQYLPGVASLRNLPAGHGGGAASAAGLGLGAMSGLARGISRPLAPTAGNFASLRGGLHTQPIQSTNTVSLLQYTSMPNQVV